MQANTTAPHVGELKAEIMRMIQKHQPVATIDISTRLPTSRFESVRYAVDLLRKEGKIKNVGRHNAARWALHSYVMQTEPVTVRRRYVKTQDDEQQKKPVKKEPATDNLAPGTMINKMAGVYVPTRLQPMRPGSMDHEACMSRRADGLVPYTGQVLTLGVKEK